MVSPGPKAIQFWVLPSQVEWYKSQASPVLIHFGPFKFGETSPKLDEAKAATKVPWNGILTIEVIE